MYKIFLFFFTVISINALAQPQLVKQRCIGYKDDEYFTDVIQNKDATFWAAMFVHDSVPEFSDAPYYNGYAMIKFDTSLTIVDKKYFGGSNGMTGITNIVRNEDNSIFLLGSTTATNGDCIGGTGHDILVIKCDSNMNKLWSKCYPMCGSFGERGIISVVDKGALISFATNCSPQGIIPTHYGSTMLNDAGLMRIDSVGNLIWVKMYGGSDIDGFAGELIKINATQYRVDINSYSNDYDLMGSMGNTDTLKRWMFIIDTAGNISKSKIERGYTNHLGHLQSEVLTNGEVKLLTIGIANSILAPTTPAHQGYEGAIVIYDSSFVIKSMKQWGGNGDDYFNSYCRDSVGNYYFAGRTSSTNGDITSSLQSKYDYWIIKTDSNYSTKWSRTFGGGSFYSENSNSPIKVFNFKNKLYFFGDCTPLPHMPDMDIVCGTYSGIPNYLTLDGWVGVFDLNTTIGIEVVNDNEAKDLFTIYPNPTSTDFTIKSITNIENTNRLLVSNLEGKVILKEKITTNQITIDVRDWSQGTYLIRIEKKGKLIYTNKVIILKP